MGSNHSRPAVLQPGPCHKLPPFRLRLLCPADLRARAGHLTELTIDQAGNPLGTIHESPSSSGRTATSGAAQGAGAGTSATSPGTTGGPGFGAQGVGMLGTMGGTARVVSIATSRLRPVGDPLTHILSQLHKVRGLFKARGH